MLLAYNGQSHYERSLYDWTQRRLFAKALDGAKQALCYVELDGEYCTDYLTAI